MMAVARRPPRPAPGPEARCRRRQAFRFLPTVGALCLAGAALLALLPGQALPLLVAAALVLALGREAAIPAGLLLGGNPFAVAAELVLLDAAVLLALAPRLAGAQPPTLVAAAARRRNGARRPRRLLGLYGRALVPFAFQGSLVAVLMGEAARLPQRPLLAVVAAASATATLAWAVLFTGLFALLGAPALVAGLVVTAPLALLGLAVSLAGLAGPRAAALRN